MPAEREVRQSSRHVIWSLDPGVAVHALLSSCQWESLQGKTEPAAIRYSCWSQRMWDIAFAILMDSYGIFNHFLWPHQIYQPTLPSGPCPNPCRPSIATIWWRPRLMRRMVHGRRSAPFELEMPTAHSADSGNRRNIYIYVLNITKLYYIIYTYIYIYIYRNMLWYALIKRFF